MSPLFAKNTSGAARLHWRVVVQTDGKLDPSRATRPLAWHLATCRTPDVADAHCPVGRRLQAAGGGDPEGHCLADGVCPRCAAQALRIDGKSGGASSNTSS
jgi:hypothetical protein